MSDSVRPHRRQPTRLPCPWDSPGKNTGAGCHFLFQCMKVRSESEVARSCPTLCDPIHGLQPTRLLRPWDFPGKSTGVGCHCHSCIRIHNMMCVCISLSGLTLCDPMDCRPPSSSVHGILQATILEWVAIPFSRGSSQPRDQTQVSHIANIFFII